MLLRIKQQELRQKGNRVPGFYLGAANDPVLYSVRGKGGIILVPQADVAADQEQVPYFLQAAVA